MKFKNNKLIILIAIIVIILLNICVLTFTFEMKSTDSKNIKTVEIQIESGMSADSILNLLKESNLIKNKLFCKIYIKLNNYNMQAGTYDFDTSMNSFEILKSINLGKVTRKYEISITFIEGKNINNYAKLISSKTNNTEADVYKLLESVDYIKELINKYWFLTDEILNTYIYYPLEGYLFPDTYIFKNKNVTVEEIFTSMLNKMNDVLTPFKEEIKEKNLNIHEFMTLASIVELEGLYSSDRATIAGVFYNRLKEGWSLGSDVTTYYAVKKDMGEYPVLSQVDIDFVSPYNTRLSSMAGKLPVGPISSPSVSSIKACIEPIETNNYYFVADCSTKKTVFTKTFEEHVIAVNKIKASGCSF